MKIKYSLYLQTKSKYCVPDKDYYGNEIWYEGSFCNFLYIDSFETKEEAIAHIQNNKSTDIIYTIKETYHI